MCTYIHIYIYINIYFYIYMYIHIHIHRCEGQSKGQCVRRPSRYSTDQWAMRPTRHPLHRRRSVSRQATSHPLALERLLLLLFPLSSLLSPLSSLVSPLSSLHSTRSSLHSPPLLFISLLSCSLFSLLSSRTPPQ